MREGAPYVETRDGRWLYGGHCGGIGGSGVGVCACGATSPVLGSAHKRKKWHREHKAGVSDA